MTYFWDGEPVVAPSDFCPFTEEVAMPARVRDASTRVRAASKGGAVTRPLRRNLLEMGLACGQGAAALEEKAAKADAVQREADGMAGIGAAGSGAAGLDGDAPGEESGEAETAGPPDPGAIAAMATEVREIGRKRDRLAEELAGLDQQQAELQAKLMQLLGKAGARSKPMAPEAPSLSPGVGLSAGVGLPTHRWNRTD